MKIAFLTDSPTAATGQGRVARELGKEFISLGHSVVNYAWNIGEVLPAYRVSWPVFSLSCDYGEDYTEELATLIEETQPDVLLFHGDFHHFGHNHKTINYLCQKEIPRPVFVGYLNVDGALPYSYKAYAAGFDKLMFTTRYGADEFLKISSYTDVNCSVHLGVDKSVFKPLRLLEHQPLPVNNFFPDVKSWDDIFLMTYVGRNAKRKSIPAIMGAFAALCVPDARLLLVTSPRDQHGHDLPVIASRMGISNKIAFIPSHPSAPISDEVMAEIYNRTDVLVSASMGEGFCLPLAEAMACGAKVIGPGYTGCKDFIPMSSTIMGKTKAWTSTGIEYRNPDIQSLEKKMREAYHKGKNPHALHGQSLLEWSEVAQLMEPELMTASKAVFTANTQAKGRSDLEVQKVLFNLAGEALRGPTPSPMMIKMGGVGDQLQVTPIIKYVYDRGWFSEKDQKMIMLVEKDYGVYHKNPYVGKVIEVGHLNQDDVVTSMAWPATPYLFDMRYLSGYYSREGLGSFFYPTLYHNWPASNARLDVLNKHVIDLMFESFSPTESFNKEDMFVHCEPCRAVDDLIGADRPYVVVHNAGGSLGDLKIWDPKDFDLVVRWLAGNGYYVVQSGLKTEPIISDKVLDFRGLSLHETAYLLKHAKLYFGIEGGMFHLAKAVGTKGAVLFSVTPPTCFAYDDTIILFNENCRPCWWSMPGWHKSCQLGHRLCVNFPTAPEVVKILSNHL